MPSVWKDKRILNYPRSGKTGPERPGPERPDSQHQLTEANDSSDYRVAFNYSPEGNGTLESVSGLNGVLLGRDPMIYSYGDGTLLGADIHAPTTLSGQAKDLHYSYDFAGNVSTRTEVSDPTGNSSQDKWNFAYDGVGQQREVLFKKGAGGRELYYYDSAGQRYMAVTYATADDSIPERIRIWMGGAELWFTPNASSNGMEVDTEYAYLSLGAINIGRIKSQGPVVSTEATFANGLSHVMGSVDWDTGIVNAAFIYGPYGEIIESVGAEQDDHLRRFNGKESDQLSKLSYYGFRYYDEQSLSWTQADPLYLFAPDIGLGNPREMSLYSFTLNNPVRYMDPDGLQAQSTDGPSTGDIITLDDGTEWEIGDVIWTIGERDPWEVGRDNAQGAYALINAAMSRVNTVWYSGKVKEKNGAGLLNRIGFEQWYGANTHQADFLDMSLYFLSQIKPEEWNARMASELRAKRIHDATAMAQKHIDRLFKGRSNGRVSHIPDSMSGVLIDGLIQPALSKPGDGKITTIGRYGYLIISPIVVGPGALLGVAIDDPLVKVPINAGIDVVNWLLD